MAMQRVTISLRKDLHERVRQLAARQGRSRSQLIREALKEAVQQAEDQAAYTEWKRIVKKGLNIDPSAFSFDRDSLHER